MRCLFSLLERERVARYSIAKLYNGIENLPARILALRLSCWISDALLAKQHNHFIFVPTVQLELGTSTTKQLFLLWIENRSIDNQDSGVGIYAGDEDSYHVFAPIFDKVIETYHGKFLIRKPSTCVISSFVYESSHWPIA